MNKIIGKIKRYTKKIICGVLSTRLFKIDEKKIVFDNFNGKGFGCNPKYIALEIIKEQLDCKMVWLVNDLNTEMPKQIKKVKFGSIRAYYELATAKVWIDNVRNSKGVKKKKKQFYIQTWHASLCLKKVEADAIDKLSEKYVKDAKIDGKITDLMISCNKAETERYKKSFWYSGEVLECGLPRNDIIIKQSPEIKEKVYSYFGISKEEKIILYASTFRKSYNGFDVYKFDYEKCIKEISSKFGGTYKMLIRLHPNVSKYCNEFKYNENIINATNYDDMQELLTSAEIVITDYSSIMIDFSLIKKPVFLFAKDYDEYMKKERGFNFDFLSLPFSIAFNEEELYKNIYYFDCKNYIEKCNEFYDRIGLYKIQHSSSKQVVERIKNNIGG